MSANVIMNRPISKKGNNYVDSWTTVSQLQSDLQGQATGNIQGAFQNQNLAFWLINGLHLSTEIHIGTEENGFKLSRIHLTQYFQFWQAIVFHVFRLEYFPDLPCNAKSSSMPRMSSIRLLLRTFTRQAVPLFVALTMIWKLAHLFVDHWKFL